MRQKLKINLLKCLHQADGLALPHAALLGAAQNISFPTPPLADLESALKDLENERLVSGATDQLGRVSWTLTDNGNHLAKKL